MKINILTIFPEMFGPIKESILGRAEEKGILEFNIVDIREFSKDKHHKTDDYPFGGGAGMVFLPQPAFDALRSLGIEPGAAKGAGSRPLGPSEGAGSRPLYMSPRGKILDEALARRLAKEEEITIFCGHYEGIDQRIIDEFDMEEVSIGDYVLTGGELAAMVLIDVFARLIPGVLATEEAAQQESVYSGLLEYPQYTKPRDFEGLKVPEVLVSGNHKLIHLWNFEQSLLLTKERRPDLFEAFVKKHDNLTKDELRVLEKVMK